MNTLAELYSAVLPTLLQLIGSILGLLLIRAANLASSRWGIEIEARHREALHSAIMSGIQAALMRGVKGEAAVTAALQHARASVPDALRALRPDEAVLTAIAKAKLQQALG